MPAKTVKATKQVDLTPQAAAQQELRRCIQLIKNATGVEIAEPAIEWSNKMTRVWGLASTKAYNGKRIYHIKLAAKIFLRDTNALRDTVAHELAHIADHVLYNGWGHGASWRAVMSMLGRNANRLVTAEEKAEVGVVIEKRQITKYEYACGCSKFLLAGAKHKNANARAAATGHTGLRCRKCHEYVKFTGIAKKA